MMVRIQAVWFTVGRIWRDRMLADYDGPDSGCQAPVDLVGTDAGRLDHDGGRIPALKLPIATDWKGH